MGLLDRLASRRGELEPQSVATAPVDEPLFATKAFGKFLASLKALPGPTVLDLGPAVGSNVMFFAERVGCKVIVEDAFAELERQVRAAKPDGLSAALARRLPHGDGSVDGVICWDIIDYLDRRSAQALADQLTRALRPGGVLLGFFGTAPPRDAQYTKYVIADESNLKYRSYPAVRGRQAVLLNRDIIRLFPDLRVSDSFLMKNNLREILFRKPAYATR
jgi:SAM-dependent methyltransferase